MATHDFDPAIPGFVKSEFVNWQGLYRGRKCHRRRMESQCLDRRPSATHDALALADLLAIRTLVARSVQRAGSFLTSSSSWRAIWALIEATIAFLLLPSR